jgi:hypothetical protein
MPICDKAVCWFFIQRFAVVLTAGIRRTIMGSSLRAVAFDDFNPELFRPWIVGLWEA